MTRFTERLVHLKRVRLLGEALRDLESEHGAIGTAEIEAEAKRDRQVAIQPKPKRKRQPTA